VTDRSPTVSVILPTLNEQGFLRDCLDTLLDQDYSTITEILVVDGGSVDATREIADAVGAPVRVLDNPRTSAAAAMNVGLAAAVGEIIVRADAHSLYATDYVRTCVDVLLETRADNVGGRMQPVGTTSFGRAVAKVTTSPFGVGPARFHYSDRRDEVDTVYLGCWRRETLERLGGYDESRLQWAAEDQELNFRLRLAGGRVVLDPHIRSVYFPRATPRALYRQYFNYGVAKASTLAKHGTLPTWRPLAPAAFVAASAFALVAGRGKRRVALPVLHAAACAAVALRLARDPGVAPHRALGALEVCHWSYGLGFWSGVGRMLGGQGFESKPGAAAARRAPSAADVTGGIPARRAR
jgi:succinoglycan biosynthesis protein ExoA